MNTQYRFMRSFLAGLSISLLMGQDPFVIDSSLSNSLPKTLANSIEIADVNNDENNDIIISGYDSTRFGLYIDITLGNDGGSFDQGYETNFITYSDTIAEYFGGIGNASLADVNMDGKIDIYVNGSARSKLLFNSGSGSFSTSSWLQNLSITYSNGNFGDFNMDGKPDLFITGVNEFSDQILNRLYVNDGNAFVNDLNNFFPNLVNGTSEWNDYDNDGDFDLIISGRNADVTASVTRLFKNDPIGRLSELTTVESLIGLKAGAFHFSDLDSDGDKDLIMTGWNKIENRLVTKILENEPLGTYSPLPNQIDFAVAYGTIDAIDINMDGLQDLVISGANSVSLNAGRVHSLEGRVYINNGNGTFTEVKQLPGARVVKFSDIDQDGAPDIIVNGTTEIGNADSTFSRVYINENTTTNEVPDSPNALTAFAVSSRAIFSWGSGSDDIDEPNSLSYNIRIGTSSGGNQLLSSSIPYNTSNVGQRLIREFNEIPHGTYYWAVQTMDGSGQKSSWSREDTLFIGRLVESTQSLPGVYFSTGGWADYNNDGYMDIALTGQDYSNESITKIFTNENGLLTQDVGQDIEAVVGGHLSWVDYDNDGYLDLSINGLQVIDFWPYVRTYFYKYDPEQEKFVEDIESELFLDKNLDDYQDYVVAGGSNSHHWGDYDNDGDLDYVHAGWDGYYPYQFNRRLDVFYNDDGILRLDTNQTDLVPIYPGMVHWTDLNLDGRLDLVTIGADAAQENLRMRCYLNNPDNILTQSMTWESEIFGVTAGAIAFGDYNSDGYDDFALTGLNANQDLVTYVVQNGINSFIVTHIMDGVYYGKPSWGDYDNDGDLDLIVTGQSSTYGQLGSEPRTLIFKQENNDFIIDQSLSIDSVGISFTQWEDYDADGDLDLFLSGFKANQDVVSKVYDNLESLENPNKAPNPPYLLDDSSIDNDKITLKWNPPVDPDNANGGSTPELGLRYQIQVGSEDQNNDHAISTGKYGIGKFGYVKVNGNFAAQKTLKNMKEGSYSWRVRAIDHGLAKSDWSNREYFYIDVTPPTIDTIRANYVSSDQIILVVKFKEDFYLDLNVEPTILVTHPLYPDIGEAGSEDDSLLVEKQSFNGDEWTGVLSLPDDYNGKAIHVHVYGAQDDRQNKMTRASIYKTPESIISTFGGTAISQDGNVSILLPQNAVTNDISISITGQNVPPDSSSYIYEVDRGITYLISDLYDIEPFDRSLLKPGILRIGFPDSTCLITETVNQYFNLELNSFSDCLELGGEWIAMPDSGMTPFIGLVDTSINGVLPVLKMGGSQISINGASFMQVQVENFGTYGAFVSTDNTLMSDSIDVESIVCQPRVFSPGGSGSVFEFTETNIMYSLETSEEVTARIFNLSGRLKRIIKPETITQPGHQILNWDGRDSNGEIVPSGLYIVTLEKEDTILRTTVGVLNR